MSGSRRSQSNAPPLLDIARACGTIASMSIGQIDKRRLCRFAAAVMLLAFLGGGYGCQCGVDRVPPADLSVANPNQDVDLGDACASDTDCDALRRCQCPAGTDLGCVRSCLPCVTACVGTDSTCSASVRAPYPIEPPVVRCSWTGGPVQVPPAVADLDGDGRPEIVFIVDRQPYGMYDEVVAIRGDDCTMLWSTHVAGIDGSLAVADLDGDGSPEIVLLTENSGFDTASGLAILDARGALVVKADGILPFWGTQIALGKSNGIALILVGDSVVSYSGARTLSVVTRGTGAHSQGTVGGLPSSFFSDVLGLGNPQIVTGGAVLRLDGSDATPVGYALPPGSGFGIPAVGDFDGDGKPDLLDSVYNPAVAALFDSATHDFRVFAVPVNSAFGGPQARLASPVIADVDGDGRAEAVFATGDWLGLFSSSSCGEADAGIACSGWLPRWTRFFHDGQWGGSDLTVFDLNGDNDPEILFMNGCWLRVLDSRDGETLTAIPINTTWTYFGLEVADVDGDGTAEIIVPAAQATPALLQPFPCGAPEESTNMPWTPPSDEGLYVYTARSHTYAKTRPVWNSATYHVTDINDNLTLPEPEVSNWTSSNRFRANLQGAAVGAPENEQLPDFIAMTGPSCSITISSVTNVPSYALFGRICNGGAATAAFAVAGTFYTESANDLGPVSPLCTAYTTLELPPGNCETVWCYTTQAPTDPMTFVANNHGKGSQQRDECHPDNNAVVLSGNCVPG